MKNNVHHARAEQNMMKVLQLRNGGMVAGEGGTGKCFNTIAN